MTYDLVQDGLPEEFDARFGRSHGPAQVLAQQLAYCLRHLSAVDICGKTGNALVYRRIT